ncbi:hypothetical protein Tco_1287466 [Tanacetum coccineum]
MSTQQDIYAAGSENRPPMLNKDNYVPWSSRLLRYAKSKPNGKLIYNSIMHGLYVRRMIPEPRDPDREVPVAKTFHEQTDDELTNKEVKQMEGDDHAIHIILIGLPEDIYAVGDSCETAQEIWFTSTDGNLKFLNNLQPEWRLHVTIVHQTKDLHEVDYTQLYDFLKYNQVENVRNQNGLIVVTGNANQSVNQNGNGNVLATRAEGNGNGNGNNENQEFDLITATWDLDEIEEVNTNCILMANLQQASTSGTQTDKAPVFDSDGSDEVHHSENCYDNEIFH